ncbi:COPII vesicle coating protein [Malassezia pachydermatis]
MRPAPKSQQPPVAAPVTNAAASQPQGSQTDVFGAVQSPPGAKVRPVAGEPRVRPSGPPRMVQTHPQPPTNTRPPAPKPAATPAPRTAAPPAPVTAPSVSQPSQGPVPSMNKVRPPMSASARGNVPPMSAQHTGRSMQAQNTGHSMQSQHTGRSMQAQNTGRSMQSQHTGRSMQAQNTGRSMQSQHTGQSQAPPPSRAAPPPSMVETLPPRIPAPHAASYPPVPDSMPEPVPTMDAWDTQDGWGDQDDWGGDGWDQPEEAEAAPASTEWMPPDEQEGGMATNEMPQDLFGQNTMAVAEEAESYPQQLGEPLDPAMENLSAWDQEVHDFPEQFEQDAVYDGASLQDGWDYPADDQDYNEPFLDPSQYDAELDMDPYASTGFQEEVPTAGADMFTQDPYEQDAYDQGEYPADAYQGMDEQTLDPMETQAESQLFFTQKEQLGANDPMDDQYAQEEQVDDQYGHEDAYGEQYAQDGAFDDQYAQEEAYDEQYAQEGAYEEQYAQDEVYDEQHAQEYAYDEQYAQEGQFDGPYDEQYAQEDQGEYGQEGPYDEQYAQEGPYDEQYGQEGPYDEQYGQEGPYDGQLDDQYGQFQQGGTDAQFVQEDQYDQFEQEDQYDPSQPPEFAQDEMAEPAGGTTDEPGWDDQGAWDEQIAWDDQADGQEEPTSIDAAPMQPPTSIPEPVPEVKPPVTKAAPVPPTTMPPPRGPAKRVPPSSTRGAATAPVPSALTTSTNAPPSAATSHAIPSAVKSTPQAAAMPKRGPVALGAAPPKESPSIPASAPPAQSSGPRQRGAMPQRAPNKPVPTPQPAPPPTQPAEEEDAWGWGDTEEVSAPATSEQVDDAWGMDSERATGTESAWGGDSDVYAHDAYAPQDYAPPPPSHTAPRGPTAGPATAGPRRAPARGPASKGPTPPRTPGQVKAGARRPDPQQDRRNATIPIVSFGIGSKLVVHMPSKGDSYDYQSSREERTVTIRSLSQLVGARPFSTLDMTKFPGPLLEGSRSQLKAKKPSIVKYLHEQIAESASGVGYLRRKSVMLAEHSETKSSNAGDLEEWRRTEDKILLLKLLVMLIENDGKLTDDAPLARSICDLLLGKTEAGEFGAFTVPTYSRATSHSSSKRPLRSYALRQSFLEELQQHLQQGQLKEAVDLALDERMWAHAMTIAQQLDEATRQRVVTAFMQYELDDADIDSAMRKDYTSIKVAYSLYTHQPAEQIAALFQGPSSLSPEAKHLQWRHAIATLISNRGLGEYDAILGTIGDGLMEAGLPEAAHVCYLLGKQHLGWLKSPETDFVLVGTKPNTPASVLLNDMDALLMTEVLEYTYALSQPSKTAPPYAGISTLAPFKLVMAAVYDELGFSASAKKYCEALTQLSQLKGAAPILTSALQAQLHELSSRLNGQHLAGQSWSKKLQRPTLDGVWGALEGRLTKFIAGEEAGQKEAVKSTETTVGAFTHYSAITPEAASAAPSETQYPSVHEELQETDGGYSADAYAQAYEDGGAETHDNLNDTYAENTYEQDADVDAYAEDQAPKEYPQEEYGQEDYAQDEYPQEEYVQEEYAQEEYPQEEYAQEEYPQDEYPQEEYAQEEYAQEEYAQEEYPQEEYAQEEYAQEEYPQEEYAQEEYAQEEYPQEEYAQEEYAQEEYPQEEYAQEEYAQEEYPQEEYPQEEYAQEEYAQEQYPQEEYPQEEYVQEEYAQEEYAREGYPQDEYAQEEYAQEEYAQEQQDDVHENLEADHAHEESGQDNAGGDHPQDPNLPADEMSASAPLPKDIDKESVASNVDDFADAETAGDEQEEVKPPTAPPLFHSVEQEVGEDGLLSTMSVPMLTPLPAKPSATNTKSAAPEPEEKEDDLGLGNSSSRPNKTESPEPISSATENSQPDEKNAKAADKASGGSWFGRLLGSRSNSASKENEKESKAVKAHLGEETSFYYDKELKRWVNKKAGDDGKAAPAALPPPPKGAPSKPIAAAGPADAPPKSLASSKPPSSAPARSNGGADAGPPGPLTRPSDASAKPASKKATGGPPSGTANKKRPLKSRYIVVD